MKKQILELIESKNKENINLAFTLMFTIEEIDLTKEFLINCLSVIGKDFAFPRIQIQYKTAQKSWISSRRKQVKKSFTYNFSYKSQLSFCFNSNYCFMKSTYSAKNNLNLNIEDIKMIKLNKAVLKHTVK